MASHDYLTVPSVHKATNSENIKYSEGSVRNYITQNFWTVTCYNPLIHTLTCAYHGVTVC